MLRPLLYLIGLHVMFGSSLWSQDEADPGATSLLGLEGFAVAVSVDARQPSLPTIDETELRRTVELALRREGIRILTRGEYDHDPAAPLLTLDYLIIQTSNKAGRETGYAGYGCLGVIQLVTLQPLKVRRRPVSVTTWDNCGILVGADELSAHLLETTEKRIAAFLNAWLAANPRRLRLQE